MPEYTAPHPALQNALFLYATGTDGAAANLIRGWSLLVDTVVSEVAGDNWPEALADLDEWQDDGWGVPHHYYVNFEDGYMHIFTVREPVTDGVRAPCLTCAANHYCPEHNPEPNTPTTFGGVPVVDGQTFSREDADPMNRVEAGTSVLHHPLPTTAPIASNGDVGTEPGEI
jgi:hypothetical protein